MIVDTSCSQYRIRVAKFSLCYVFPMLQQTWRATELNLLDPGSTLSVKNSQPP